jgi:TonB family protein
MAFVRRVLGLSVAGGVGIVAAMFVFDALAALTAGEATPPTARRAARIEFTFRAPLETLTTTRGPKPEYERETIPDPGEIDWGSGAGGLVREDAHVTERVSYSLRPGPIGGSHGLENVDPQPIVRIPPEVPPNARGDGWVLVQFDVSETGTVVNARVLAAEPEGVFEKSALRAIERWRYRPAVIDGRAAPRRGLRVKLSFVLEEA